MMDFIWFLGGSKGIGRDGSMSSRCNTKIHLHPFSRDYNRGGVLSLLRSLEGLIIGGVL